MSNMLSSLEYRYRMAVSAEESASSHEEACRLAAKTERCLNQLKLARDNNLPPVARKSVNRLQRMMSNSTYEQVVEFIQTHHYGGCACGCGAAVRKLFKQGHDMKLRSRIKQMQEGNNEATGV